jgi:hypothetical protein
MPTKEQVIKELATVINRFNMEKLFGANVPDYILAEVALEAIYTFAKHFKQGCEWYNVHLEPCGKSHFLETVNG